MNRLYQATKLIETLISETPTSDLRNKLTDINILILTGMEEVTEKFKEIQQIIRK